MPIPTSVNDLSTVDSTNSPQGSDPVGGNVDDFFRALSGIIARAQKKGIDLAVDLSNSLPVPMDGMYFNVTSTAQVQALASTFDGKMIVLRFTQSMTLVNGSGLILPANANIITQPNDYAIFIQESTGVWRCIFYQNWIKLGTSATSDITTSATDSTAGRLTKIGDFGIGAKAAAPFATNADDWLMPNGIYQVTGATTGTLPEPYGSLFVCGSPGQDSASNWAQQFFLSTTGNVYYRSSTNLAAWTTWQKIYNTGNLPGALTGTATIPQVSGGPQNGNFTITSAHAGMHVLKDTSGTTATTWTIAAGSPVGAAVTLVNFGANITLTSNDGLLYYVDGAGNLLTGSRTLAKGIATILKFVTGWVVSGTGIS